MKNLNPIKNLSLILILSLFFGSAITQKIKGPIKVHPNQYYLMTAEGIPLFWMADTAWELFHKLDEKEATDYLDIRRMQGF